MGVRQHQQQFHLQCCRIGLLIAGLWLQDQSCSLAESAPDWGGASRRSWAIAPVYLTPYDADSSALLLAQESSAPPNAEALDLDPTLYEDSPVLQRWQEDIPDVLEEIADAPSFRTRIRFGYTRFLASDDASGLSVGIEDVLLGRSGFTVSADYQASFDGDREAYGTDLRYYLLPLGRSINLAPMIGYHALETEDYSQDGLSIGLKLLLVLSRTGAADVSLSQNWLALGSDAEISLTTLSFGYALTEHLRLSTELQRQNAQQGHDSQIGILLEWML